jgi:hypothetical protein
MQKIAESKPSKHTTNALKQLETLGLDTAMLGSKGYIERKLMQVGAEPIKDIFIELSRHEGNIRRRIANISNPYPRHEEFTQKLAEFNAEQLVLALARFGFCVQSKAYLFWDSSK